MATVQQIDANRRNAQLSTGPQTEAGKATSSHNSTSHGLSAAHIILPGEDASAFSRLLANLASEHASQGETESFLVRQIAQNQWKLDRLDRIEAAIYRFVLEGRIESATDTKIAGVFMGVSTPEVAFDRLERYRNSARGAYHKSIKELRASQSLREKRENAENKTNPIAAPPAESNAEPEPENRTKPIPIVSIKTVKAINTVLAPADARSNAVPAAPVAPLATLPSRGSSASC